MALTTGTKLGPYEIVQEIGSGGMGEVYRAKDTRLHREVAFKILSGDGVDNPERQRRFAQEARAASALNHPNILSVYDVGSENGTQYIVSEFIDGDSLRKLIQKGPVPTKKLLDVAIQIADGLAAALSKSERITIWARASVLYEAANEQHIPPIVFATIYTQLKQKDQAFLWLEKMYEERHPWLVYAKTDPQFEALRSDPRFNELMHRIGL